MPDAPNKSMIIKKDGHIQWYAWCIICNKKLDQASDGAYVESYARKHTEETGHTTLIGCMIIAIVEEKQQGNKQGGENGARKTT